jgi:hypothetical protein
MHLITMKKNENKIIKIMIENLVYWIHSDLSQVISVKQRLFFNYSSPLNDVSFFYRVYDSHTN